MLYLGNYATGTTIDFMWSSNDAGGASITRGTNGTVSVYKGNSTTQTTTGVTDTEDFDSLTGIHHCRIVTTDSFYAAGNDYMVVLSGATIDTKSVNAVLAMFSIQNRYHPIPPTAAAIADAVWDEDAEGHLTAGTMGAYQDAAAADTWDQMLDDYTEEGTFGKALGDLGGAGGDAGAIWDVPLIDHLLPGSTGLALTNAERGNKVYDSATAAENLRKAFTGQSYSAAGLTVGVTTSVTNTVNANLVNLGGDANAFAALLALARVQVVGTVTAGTNTTTVVTSSGLSGAADFYVGKTFAALTGTNAKQGGKLVVDYDPATKRLTIEALTAAMAAGDTFVLMG